MERRQGAACEPGRQRTCALGRLLERWGLRHHLIIEDLTVKALSKTSGKTADSAIKKLQQTLRVWTDATGKYKIEARFVSQTETEVTLTTDAGREIQMPIEKLSKKDRELLDNAAPSKSKPGS